MSDPQKEVSKISRVGGGINPSTRRSQLEIMMDILSVVDKGAQKPTQVMYRANLAWTALKSYLDQLVEEGLLEKRSGTRNELVITERGKRVVESFNEIVGHLRPQTVDYLIQSPMLVRGDPSSAEIEQRLDRLEESIEVLTDKQLLRREREGLRDLKAGRYKKFATANELLKTLR